MKLICGNCYDELKNIPDNSVDLVVTDPPYEIIGLNGAGIIKNRPYLRQMMKSNLGSGINIDLLDELSRIMKHIYIYIYGAIKSKFTII